MIRIGQIKLSIDHTDENLRKKVAKTLKISSEQILELHIRKQSIDARKKDNIQFSYCIDVKTKQDAQIVKRCKNNQITLIQPKKYSFPSCGEEILTNKPIIIGMGPAGLFCAYMLAKHGYQPILFDRGKAVEDRILDVETFWEGGKLNPDSNTQFGEGGAGTFSDGKLNTLVKDKDGKNQEVLNIFVAHGAPKNIIYKNKPHIGTDILVDVVRNMRNEILRYGGKIHFESKVTELLIKNNRVEGILLENGMKYSSSVIVLAIGHSARDTFHMLHEKKIPMDAKSFAVGFRVEHPQELINISQYGVKSSQHLEAADYKVVAKTSNGRGTYSFCMCPGGYVVNASSEEGRLCVNGMSYSKRDSKNANSAIIVGVTPEDFGSDDPLAGIHFQRQLEEKAYQLGNGKIPVEYLKDFSGIEKGNSKIGEGFTPCMKGKYVFAPIHHILPDELNRSFLEGMEHFNRMIPGFSDDYCLVSGIESRTSSPIRIHRDTQTMESVISGLYPCGEGAGYAGGITSAAMDGISVAETIAKRYQSSVK
ncbi:MAG: NAD(P)/FAD-dependent oxidoreductase [Eubacteriales bacterium]